MIFHISTMVPSITENRMLVNTHKTYNVQVRTLVRSEDIHTTVTANPAVVTDWIDDIQYRHRFNRLIVGLDVEWRPSYSPQPNPVATLQLCVRDRCLSFQFLHSNNQIPTSLAEFLSPEHNFITFVGVGIKADLEKLQRDHGIGGAARYVDLARHAAEVFNAKEWKTVGLKDLAMLVLNEVMEKPREVTMSRWDQRWLTPEQVKYACMDAYVSFEIGRVLLHLGN